VHEWISQIASGLCGSFGFGVDFFISRYIFVSWYPHDWESELGSLLLKGFDIVQYAADDRLPGLLIWFGGGSDGGLTVGVDHAFGIVVGAFLDDVGG
jgi:hypothetical protein